MGDNEAFGLLFGKTVRKVFLANTPNNRKSHEESNDYRVKPSLQPSSKPIFLDTPYAYDNPRNGKGSRWKEWQDDKLEFTKLFEKELWDGQVTTYREFMHIKIAWTKETWLLIVNVMLKVSQPNEVH